MTFVVFSTHQIIENNPNLSMRHRSVEIWHSELIHSFYLIEIVFRILYHRKAEIRLEQGEMPIAGKEVTAGKTHIDRGYENLFRIGKRDARSTCSV